MEDYYKQRCATLEALVSKLAERLFRSDLDLVKETLQVLSGERPVEDSNKPPQEKTIKEPELPKQDILNEI